MMIGQIITQLAPAAPASNEPEANAAPPSTAMQFAALLSGMLGPAPTTLLTEAVPEGLSELDGSKDGDASSDDTGKNGGDGANASAAQPTGPGLTAGALDPNSTGDVIRSIGQLDPALQAKLARVTQRMREEAGRNVEVVETVRSQSRQDALYAQGRTTAGPVVTWTQHSKHTSGRAVDVMVDGSQADAEGYATLQRIAKEEGLRTLGARDPGHLELATQGAKSAELAAAATLDAANDSASARLGQLAQVGRVAQVAQVAQIASVARVARPGQAVPSVRVGHAIDGASVRVEQLKVNEAGGAASTDANAGGNTGGENPDPNGRPANAVRAATVGARNAQTPTSPTNDGEASATVSHRERTSRAGSSTLRASTLNGDGDRRDGGAYLPLGGPTSRHLAAVDAPVAATHVSSAARAEAVHAALDAAPTRPMSQITMSVDAGNGTSDQVQIAMRGRGVDAVIDAGDPRAATEMSARAGELSRALTRDGLDLEQLTIRSTALPGAVKSESTSNNSARSNGDDARGGAWQDQSRQRDRDRQEERRQQQYQQRDERRGRNP